MKLGLSNMERLSELLGLPHTKFRSVHVTGTNGWYRNWTLDGLWLQSVVLNLASCFIVLLLLQSPTEKSKLSRQGKRVHQDCSRASALGAERWIVHVAPHFHLSRASVELRFFAHRTLLAPLCGTAISKFCKHVSLSFCRISPQSTVSSSRRLTLRATSPRSWHLPNRYFTHDTCVTPLCLSFLFKDTHSWLVNFYVNPHSKLLIASARHSCHVL
jgi:hypothetical protein